MATAKFSSVLNAAVIILITIFVLIGCSESEIPTPTATPPETRVPPTALPPKLTPTATKYVPTFVPTPDLPDIYDSTIFDYDSSQPLNPTQVLFEHSEGSYFVYYVTYKDRNGCAVMAYLVTPDGPGPYPAVIYLHRDMGHGATFKLQGNKDQFLEEAKLLAGHQVASLLLDSPFLNGCGDVHNQREGLITQVVDIRRGIDYLEQLSIIDIDRIAFVGHSYGATWGGVVAGVEPRIKAFVLMGGHAIVGKSVFHITNHVPETHDMEPYIYISHAGDVPILFMFAEQDQFVTPEMADLYYSSANDPKEMIWYETDHYGLAEVGQEDRLVWLAGQLGFEYP